MEAAAREAIARPGREAAPGVLPAGVWADLAAQARPACTIRQAVFGPQARIPAREAEGRVCALPTVACPPAIPIAVSGEVIGPARRRPAGEIRGRQRVGGFISVASTYTIIRPGV